MDGDLLLAEPGRPVVYVRIFCTTVHINIDAFFLLHRTVATYHMDILCVRNADIGGTKLK